MGKVAIFAVLLLSYALYSVAVYSSGTKGPAIEYSTQQQAQINRGKELFQQNNCIACHQLYGLGGYLGPELTTAWSDKNRGEAYIGAMLSAGSRGMPNFKFNQEDIQSIIQFLRYVDSTASTYKSNEK